MPSHIPLVENGSLIGVDGKPLAPAPLNAWRGFPFEVHPHMRRGEVAHRHNPNPLVVVRTGAHGRSRIRSGTRTYELYLMDAPTGSNKRRVTYWPGFDGLPVLSPDGHWLLWSSKRTKDATTQIIAAEFSIDPR